MNLMMLLEMAASGFAERVAVQSAAAKLTYGELFAASGAAAKLFAATPARHAALLDTTSPAMPVELFGSAWAGLPFVPLNYRLTGAELEALFGRIEPAYLVCDPEREAALQGRSGFSVISRTRFLASVSAGGDTPGEWPMDGDDIAVLLFTSGTTGVPKAAVLRHKHLVSYILGSVEFGAADEGDAALVSVPPYHIAGIAAVLSSVYGGRRIVQLPAFTPEGWLETARNQRVTHAFVVPTMLARIVDVLGDRGDAGLPHLRAIAYGGGKMPLAVIERAMKLFPAAEFTNAYGLTETSSTIAVLGPDDHRAAAASDDPAVRRRLVSVGRALPGVEIEIRDENGQRVAAGASGEICVRGEQVSGEYLGRGSTLGSDGWFATRDGGSMDSEGYVFIEGRIDDVIVRGGENLSPGEIEDVLLDHEDVADCAVVGVPDVEWGEAVAAVIVPRATAKKSAEVLRDWVKARLRSSRVPQRIEFWDELPYNETGKLLRRKVREALAARSS
jgi:acyl-CoA synthetase (AMP-forming)/AMP-acid ligase II